MAQEVNGIIDDQINEKLKKIMQQRNIHNDVVVESHDDENEDLYQEAARIINEYIAEAGYSYDEDKSDMDELYAEFQGRYSPEKLMAIPDSELLRSLFYTSESTNDSMCYYLEFHSKIKKCFGSIAGGSSHKFGLFQRKEDGLWITGSSNNQTELSENDALKVGKDIRDSLVRGAKIISESVLDSIHDYEKLDEELNDKIGKLAGLGWVHKYYHMIFPDKFSTWHSSGWQQHVLYAFGISPSERYYGRSGQLMKIAHYAGLMCPEFGGAAYDRFGNIKQFTRIGTSDDGGNYFTSWRADKVVAIGWNELEGLDTHITGSDFNKNAVRDRLVEYYYKADQKTASRKAGEIQCFYKSNTDTVFVAMDGERLLGLGDGVGSYFYSDDKPMAHCKSIDWHICFDDDEKLPNKTEGLLTTCVQISKPENLLYLYHKYYYELKKVSEDQIDMPEENKLEKREARTQKKHPINQIIYGAPGTGKTYSSVEYAIAIIEDRDVDLKQQSLEERKAKVEKYESYVEAGQIMFTTFHQSYGYEEFIQGIRPELIRGGISFKIKDGIFKTIADKAMKDHDNNYVIVIDEINRGNISKIFGELITLIEEDKRWGELNQMSATLPLGARFAVPNNLYIIGTMNSADKSISLIDTALRRRFDFVEMAPNPDVIEDATLKSVLFNLNTYLRKDLGSTDLLIGHSYFIGKTKDQLADIMNRNIIPLLYEYFYDDEAKVKKALECIADAGYEIDTSTMGRIRIKKKEN